MDNKNKIKVYTTSSGAELSISAPFTKQVISATNNRAQYFAEQALKYRDEAKVYRDSAKYYAEQNSDVTFEYIDNIRAALEEKISLKQTAGDYLLKNELPQNVSAFFNDAKYVNESNLEERLPLHNGNKDSYLYTNGESVEWKKINSGLEIGDIGFTQMAIDESNGKRRILNGQLIIQDQYVQFTNIIKNSVALNPDLACTESEWQTELTVSANGVCYKYVIDDEAGTIRLPKYPTYLDLSINTSAVSQTVSVYGNGKALGISDGTSTCFTGSNQPSSNTQGLGLFISGTASNPTAPNLKTKASSLTNNTWGSGVFVGLSKNASLSGITGKVTIPAVKSEQIKGTYFIQVATGSETEDNIINEIELNNPYSLFDSKYSDHELNNLSWLKSEGQWNAKAVYPTAYDKLLKVYNGTETVEGLSVKLSTETYTDYDFVLNTTDETFRLPLKNHTADDGNSVLTLYFYVGETVQNANLINAGRIEEKVAGLIPDNSNLISSYGMPSSKYINLTLGSSYSTYTAPANGYFACLLSIGSGTFNIYVQNNLLGTQFTTTIDEVVKAFVPVQKGQIMQLVYPTPTTQTYKTLRFIYAEGAKND